VACLGSNHQHLSTKQSPNHQVLKSSFVYSLCFHHIEIKTVIQFPGFIFPW
jgi:hypothetical protein